MNARMGKEDRWNVHTEDGELEVRKRTSRDKVTNTEEKDLIKKERLLGVKILDGNVNGDEEGKIH